jgi:serine/threonine-protein kinase
MIEPHDPNQTVDTSSTPSDPLDAGLAAGFGRPGDGPGSVRADLRSRFGSLQPVLLGEAEGESGHIVKPKSDAMPPPEQTGDRYQLSGEIARGGMGAVLRGRDVDLGRDLAVKVLLEKYADRPEVVRRFLEEAQVGAQLQHPGIVPVYDIGRFGERPFFTMKLVKGQTLAALLKERPDPAADRPRLLNIALQVAQTLAYTHAKGVIHRDLKPSNVMVGAFGEVQVMDWGLAKVLAEGGVADEERTAGREHERPEDVTTIRTARSGSAGSGTDTEAGSLLGTPAYMPPEQANGDVALLDRRADVFGLGALLCEILTGQPPYVGRSPEEIRRKAANGDLAEARARLDGCGADGELVTLTIACLSPEAIDRPKDARAVADALTAYLDGVQERLHQAELAEAEARARAAEEAKRRRLTLALAATVLLALTLGGGTWLWLKADRDARQAQVTLDVHDALNQATALREKARTAPVGSAALFAQAREQAQRALALVQSSPADAALRDQVQRLHRELDEEENDRKLIAALDEARLAQAETVAGENRFALERAVPLFRKAFQAYGLTAGKGDAAAAAEYLRQRPAAVREAVSAALDAWLDQVADPKAQVVEPYLDWLKAVGAAVEPDEGWVREFRAARAEKDKEKQRTALEKLARSADMRRLPPHALNHLAWRLIAVQAEASAVQLLRRAWEQYPADFWVNHNLGMALGYSAKPRDLVGAVRYLTAAVALRPDSPGVHYNLGNALAAQKDLAGAIACYQKALELDPKYANAHNNLGSALSAQKDWKGAIASFKQALELDPKNALAHYNLGNALWAQGNLKGAIACFKTALDLDPKDAKAHYNLGVVLFVQGDRKGALERFRKAVDLDSKFALAHNDLGFALFVQGNLKEAIACYTQALKLDPKFALAHINLGKALQAQGDGKGAITCFKKVLDFDPKSAPAYYNLGQALKAQGDLTGAIAFYREALALAPKDAPTHYDLGMALFERGDRKEALEHFHKAVDLDPKDAQAHNNLGYALFVQGDLKEAIACYTQALKLDPKYVLAHNNLGNALKAQGNLAGAMACYRKALDLDPKDAKAHYNLGVVLFVQGDRKGALEHFHKAVDFDPKSALAHNDLGFTLFVEGNLKEAIACYNQALKLDPKFVLAHMNLGDALQAQGDEKGAITCFKKALQLAPKDAKAHAALGLTLLAQGDFKQARAATQQALELMSPDHPRRPLVSRQLHECQRLLELDARLPSILAGDDHPADAAEQLALADLCQRYKKRYAAAARFYQGAFVAQPKLAEEVHNWVRYNAACAAALAGCGQGKDADTLNAKERAQHRQDALDWLRADLALWSKLLNSGKPADLAAVKGRMEHWRNDHTFDGVHNPAALAKLPETERKTWQQFWREVEALHQKASTAEKTP